MIITLRQAKALVEFFEGTDAEVVVNYFEAREMKGSPGVEYPAGLYAWCREYPKEGAQYLGPTEVSDV